MTIVFSNRERVSVADNKGIEFAIRLWILRNYKLNDGA